MKTLGQFLNERGLSQRAFAKRINVDQSVVSRFVNGEAKPGLAVATRIERETDGAVPATSWIQPQDTAA